MKATKKHETTGFRAGAPTERFCSQEFDIDVELSNTIFDTVGKWKPRKELLDPPHKCVHTSSTIIKNGSPLEALLKQHGLLDLRNVEWNSIALTCAPRPHYSGEIWTITITEAGKLRLEFHYFTGLTKPFPNDDR